MKLPNAGLAARVATVSWTTASEEDDRLAREPDVRVPLTSADFLAGHDPVLDAALAILD